MKRLWPMLALSVLLLPATARAEPIAISLQSTAGALFAGGSASVIADELTNRGDILMFTGLGRMTAQVAFGLRDRMGGRGFLLRISTNATSPAAVPEPASMLLIGTGLAGLVARRRTATAA